MSDEEKRLKAIESVRRWQKAYPVRYMLTRIKRNAKRWDYEYDLDEKFIKGLLTGMRCARTGHALTWDDNSPYRPSIDRIDGKRGYTRDNVQMTCLFYNLLKNRFTDEQAVAFIRGANA